MLDERFVHDGGVVFDDGAPAQEAFIVRSGRVEISKIVENRRVILAHLEPGQIFGEIALLRPHSTRTARARAVEPTTLVVIPRHYFQKMLDGLDKVSRQIVVTLAQRVESTTRLKKFNRAQDPLRAYYDLFSLLDSQSEGDTIDGVAAARTFRRVLGMDRDDFLDVVAKLHSLNLVKAEPSPKNPATLAMVEQKGVNVLLKRLSQELGERHFDFRQNRSELQPLVGVCEDGDLSQEEALAALVEGKVSPVDIHLTEAGVKALTRKEEEEEA